jgi:hypothetical protein
LIGKVIDQCWVILTFPWELPVPIINLVLKN